MMKTTVGMFQLVKRRHQREARCNNYIHTQRFNSHFPHPPRLASSPLHHRAWVILIQSTPTGRAKTLCTQMVIWGFEPETFTDRMPFQPNQSPTDSVKTQVTTTPNVSYDDNIKFSIQHYEWTRERASGLFQCRSDKSKTSKLFTSSLTQSQLVFFGHPMCV